MGRQNRISEVGIESQKRRPEEMTKTFKIMLTFDVDAETLWTAPDPLNDPLNSQRPSMLSQGSYGPVVAIPRIIKLLDQYEIKSSFYIPGETVVKYPEMVAELHKRGHEIGNHGYTHRCPNSFDSRAKEANEYEETNTAIEKIIGEKPKGFRAPSWEFSLNTLSIIKEMGFMYDSTMMGGDQIGMLSVFDEMSNIVEIPINWTLCICQLKNGPRIRSKNGPLCKPLFGFTNPVTVTTHINDMGFMGKSINQRPC